MLKKSIATVFVIGIIMMGASHAKAGILMSDFTSGSEKTERTQTSDNGCSLTDDKKESDGGVIIRLFKSVFGKELKDVVFGDDNTPTNCGVIIQRT